MFYWSQILAVKENLRLNWRSSNTSAMDIPGLFYWNQILKVIKKLRLKWRNSNMNICHRCSRCVLWDSNPEGYLQVELEELKHICHKYSRCILYDSNPQNLQPDPSYHMVHKHLL